MISKILLQNIGANFVLQILTFAFPLVTLPYVTGVLGVSVFGVVSFYSVVAGCFGILAMYGFDHSATRKIQGLEGDPDALGKLFSLVQWSKLLLVGFSALAFFGLLCILPPPVEHLGIAWSSFLLTLGAGLNPNWFFQGRMKIQEMVWINILFKLITLLLVFTLINSERDAWLFLTLSAFSVIGPALCGVYKIHRVMIIPKVSLPFKSLIRELIDGRWMFGISLLLFLNQSAGILLLGQWHTMEDVAIYSLGWRFMNVVMAFVLGPIVTSIFPLTGKDVQRDPHKGLMLLMGYTWRITALLILLSIPYYFLLEAIFPYVFHVEYVKSLYVLAWLLAVPIFGAITHMLNIQYLVNLKMEKLAFKTLISSSILGWLSITWATKNYGLVGTTLGALGLEVLVLITFCIVVLRFQSKIHRPM